MWNKIKIDNRTFLISKTLVDKNWKISLTDLKRMWVENLSPEKILAKCQELNPLLELEQLDITYIIHGMLENIENYIVNISIKEIKLQKIIEGGKFRFTIDFTEVNGNEFWDEITVPLCFIASKLQRENDILIEEIKKKDEEITEYKLNGAELIRKNIETKLFHQDLLKVPYGYDKNNDLMSIFESLMNKNIDLMSQRLNSEDEKVIDENTRIEIRDCQEQENRMIEAKNNFKGDKNYTSQMPSTSTNFEQKNNDHLMSGLDNELSSSNGCVSLKNTTNKKRNDLKTNLETKSPKKRRDLRDFIS